MKLIVGLGNPGIQYAHTRHNVGFDVLKKLASKLGLSNQWKERFNGLFIKNDDYILLRPTTFMNDSGKSVMEVINFFKIPVTDIIVVYDDMDHALGKAVVKTTGSAGGHNGIKNIIEKLNTKEIRRIKVGIGRPEYPNTKDYVLSKFSADEQKIIDEVEDRCVNFLETFLFNDIRFAITEFNTYEK